LEVGTWKEPVLFNDVAFSTFAVTNDDPLFVNEKNAAVTQFRLNVPLFYTGNRLPVPLID